MRHPFRYYCYVLAERFGVPLAAVQTQLSSQDIAEWMAFDRTKNPDWMKTYQKELELERSRNMTDEEKLRAFKDLLGGKKKK